MNVKLDISRKKKQNLQDLKDSIKQVNTFKKGILKLKNAKDFLKSL
ncbi:MAG: hypothetical protein IPL26_15910 [Leptospiraceae bacterium]|nr:hypothetical protein [Leptospiraceae bacterium]